MKKKIFISVLCFISSFSFASCIAEENAYSSVVEYLSLCKNDPVDCSGSHPDPRCISCPIAQTKMIQSFNVLGMSPVTEADKMCPHDPVVEGMKIIQYKSKLNINNQYNWQNPCQINTVVPQPSGIPSTFREYFDLMFDEKYCGF